MKIFGGENMGCFESYMEFREEVDKVKMERRHKAVLQPPEDVPNFITEDL